MNNKFNNTKKTKKSKNTDNISDKTNFSTKSDSTDVKEVKKSRLSKDAEIYNPERSDHIVKGQFKKMSFKDKVIHFKEYYLTITIAIVVLALLVTCVILINNSRDTEENIFYCGFLNGIALEHMTQSDMPKEFTDYLNEHPDYEEKADKNRIFIPTFKNDIIDTTRIDGYFDEGVFDAFLVHPDTFNGYASKNALMDLTKIFSEDELKELDSRVIYVINKKNGEKTPMGILMDNTKYEFKIGNTVLEGDLTPIYCVPTCAGRLEEAKHFAFFLLEE